MMTHRWRALRRSQRQHVANPSRPPIRCLGPHDEAWAWIICTFAAHTSLRLAGTCKAYVDGLEGRLSASIWPSGYALNWSRLQIVQAPGRARGLNL